MSDDELQRIKKSTKALVRELQNKLKKENGANYTFSQAVDYAVRKVLLK